MQEEKEMTFFDHLEELRWHIIRSIIVVFVLSVIAFIFKKIIFDIILFGPTQPDFATYKFICELTTKWFSKGFFCMSAMNFKIVNLELTAQFFVHLKAAAAFGLVAGFPYVIWEIWRFISPGMYKNEAKQTQNIVLFSGILFFIGVAFGYFVLVPFSMQFFSTYSISDTVKNTFSLSNYISFITMFVFVAGFMFQLPIVVLVLSNLGLLTPRIMRDYRKYAIVIILIISAFITPADLMSLFLVAIPLLLLYELSIFISAFANSKKESIE